MATMRPSERAQLAMALEVCAGPKPGNVDRCHDYEDTRLEHFLASAIFVKPALERAERGEGGVGELIRDAVKLANVHAGGNTHFGAYILLFPLILGGDIAGAADIIRKTTVEDAVLFYEAFGLTQVRAHPTDDLDVNDPESVATIRREGMTLADIIAYSAPRDLVCREWTEGYPRTRRAADMLRAAPAAKGAIPAAFIELLAAEPDTFIAKKLGDAMAEETTRKAQEVRDGTLGIEEFDEWCHEQGANPGSTADIIIAAIYVALGEGWNWES
ncbi:triphosphoribosyl-dephospho-CoA synthase [Methanovulcanius yangii]|uniref:triphosphoribosyl-dephospho-CoA synthase n=1 Tax=Methanovulcanius yangii TaxID=1789227 RepID=UPI0029C9B719|nr:triphosphoribosyl-dephospho-CoA synthase [Methanovulcanius yangii]